MAGISANYQKRILDWSLGGTAAVAASTWAVGLSVGVPTSVSGSEISPSSGYTRQLATFAPAASPAGSASQSNAMTFGPFSTACTVSGIHVWDTLAATSGNMIVYGTLATARTLGVGDSIVVNAGALVVTLV
jgi:hypothetical protein